MVGARHDDQPRWVGGLDGVPAAKEHLRAAKTGGVEERVARRVKRQHSGSVVVEEARMFGVDDQEEVSVERQRLAGSRFPAFRDDDRVRIRRVEPPPDVTPDIAGQSARLQAVVAFDQREGHIDAEPSNSALEPERHDVLQGLHVAPWSGVADGRPPRFGLLISAQPKFSAGCARRSSSGTSRREVRANEPTPAYQVCPRTSLSPAAAGTRCSDRRPDLRCRRAVHAGTTDARLDVCPATKSSRTRIPRRFASATS